MYAEESPCIPRPKRKAIGTESTTVRNGPKESRVKVSLRAFFNCGNGEQAPSLRVPFGGLELLVINGVTDTGGFSFQRNYILVDGISKKFSYEASNYEA